MGCASVAVLKSLVYTVFKTVVDPYVGVVSLFASANGVTCCAVKPIASMHTQAIAVSHKYDFLNLLILNSSLTLSIQQLYSDVNSKFPKRRT